MMVAKHRDKLAQLRLRELEIERKEGELIPLDDVVKYAAEKVATVRGRFLDVETQIPHMSAEQREVLRAAIVDCFAEVHGVKGARIGSERVKK
jgi:hypothetical protein